MPKFRTLLTTFVTAIGVQLLTLLSGVIIARSLHAEGRGAFAAVQLWPGILCAFGLLGVNYSLGVRAAQDPTQTPALARIALAIGGAVSAIIIAALWFAGPWLLPSVENGTQLMRLYLLATPAVIITSFLQSIDQGAGRMTPFNVTRVGFSLLYVGAVVGCWVLGFRTVPAFVLCLLAAHLCTLLVRLNLSGWASLRVGAPLRECRATLAAGAPFLVTNAVQIAREYLERLLLLYILGVRDLGLYVVAVSAAGIHTTLAKSVNTLILPRSGSLSFEAATRDTARMFRMMALVSGGITLAMVAILPALIRLFFGPAFEGAVLPALVLLWSQYFASQGAMLDEGLRARSQPQIGLFAWIVSLLAFSILAVVITPRFGPLGVAASAVFGQLTYCGFLVVYFRRKFQSELFPTPADVRFLRGASISVLSRFVRQPASRSA